MLVTVLCDDFCCVYVNGRSLNLAPGEYADIEQDDAEDLQVQGKVRIVEDVNGRTKDKISDRTSELGTRGGNTERLPKNRRINRRHTSGNADKKRHAKGGKRD